MLVGITDSEAGDSESGPDDGRIFHWLEFVVYFGMVFSAGVFLCVYLTKHDQTFFYCNDSIIVSIIKKSSLFQQNNFTSQDLNQSRGLAVALVPRGKRISKMCFLVGKLRGPCQCKKQSVKPDSPSCFLPFASGDLWERLQQWRERFASLHKLDQDRFATWPSNA